MNYGSKKKSLTETVNATTTGIPQQFLPVTVFSEWVDQGSKKMVRYTYRAVMTGLDPGDRYRMRPSLYLCEYFQITKLVPHKVSQTSSVS